MSTTEATVMQERAQKTLRWLDELAEELGRLAGETEAAYGAEASARVLRAHVGVGELDKVRSVLHHEIVALMSGETEGGRHGDA